MSAPATTPGIYQSPSDARYGDMLPARNGWSQVIASLDFEGYSEAGYRWDAYARKWRSLKKGKPGLAAVGGWVYSVHPSTEVHCAAYDLKDGLGSRLWAPGMPLPLDLFEHIAAGKLIGAWNSFFEFAIWQNVCQARMGWPALPIHLLRDHAAKARAYSLPSSLEGAGAALGAPIQKDHAGSLVMRKLSRPRNPTKDDPRLKYTPADSPEEFNALYRYCETDIASMDSVASMIADLPPRELEYWLTDQRVNVRGIHVDRVGMNACIEITRQATERYCAEIQTITAGEVPNADSVEKIKTYLGSRGVQVDTLTKDDLPELIDRPGMPSDCKRVVEIRKILGSKSVQKAHTLALYINADDRVRGVYQFRGAARSGRAAGKGPQPQNMPKAGPPVIKCSVCAVVRWKGLPMCPACMSTLSTPTEWGIEAATRCLGTVRTCDLNLVEALWGDPLKAVAGCIRALFTAAPGMELVCVDLDSIEARVMAEMAGETWRQQVFRGGGKIYEESAAKLASIPIEELLSHREETGEHHRMRKVGKVAELAWQFGGSLGAWRNMIITLEVKGLELSDDEVMQHVYAWRRASPAIVGFWYSLEAAARAAIQNPGVECPTLPNGPREAPHAYRAPHPIIYKMHLGVLHCYLPSGRTIDYHGAQIEPDGDITYLTSSKGQWVRAYMWGGKQAENIIQSLARDIFYPAMTRLEHAGFPTVLHTHDELALEVWPDTITVQQVEAAVCVLDPWAAGWPVTATGGWHGVVYRKD